MPADINVYKALNGFWTISFDAQGESLCDTEERDSEGDALLCARIWADWLLASNESLSYAVILLEGTEVETVERRAA